MSQPAERAEPPLTPTRYLVLVWLCSAAAIAYVHRNCLGVAEKTIRQELGLSLDEMGLVMGSFFFGYAVFQIPSGWVAASTSPPVCAGCWSIRTVTSLIANEAHRHWACPSGLAAFALLRAVHTRDV